MTVLSTLTAVTARPEPAMLLLVAPTAGSFITGIELYVDGGFTGMSI